MKNTNIYIICKNKRGGSWRYINDIISHYDNNYIFIDNNEELEFVDNSLLIIQYFLDTYIQIDNLLDKIVKHKLQVIIPLHDFSWISGKIIRKNEHEITHNSYLNKKININKDIIKLFDISRFLIAPSKFVYDIYSKFFNNVIFVPHNDYELENNMIIPKIKNSINIGIFHEFSVYKGRQIYQRLINTNSYLNYKINFFIVGHNIPIYKETEFNEHIKTYQINGFMFLNKWGETYCYTLTKALNSGLPIFYNNIGSFKERIPKKENYFININSENEFTDLELLYSNYYKFLDYIVKNNKDDYVADNNQNIKYNSFYDNLF